MNARNSSSNAPGRRPALQPKAYIMRVAAEVVRKANRDCPADAVLRETLRNERELSPAQAREISRAVFAYHRWRGWLQNEKGAEGRIRRALELAERFRQNPFTLPVEDLRAKAVPEWTADEVQINDEWLRSLQREPALWLRSRRGQGRALAAKLGDCHSFGKGLLADTLRYSGNKDLFRTAEFHAGEFELQDINSQAVGFLCAPKPGEIWWDACAGEGGKMLHLSVLMENKGLIWASDRAPWRLRKLKRRAARAKVFNYRAAAWDGGPKLPTRTRFDGVLVDAPCSGVGTWQRNPHARSTTTLEDVRELAALQKQLLANVAPSVKPGGKLVYAVCTVAHSETSEVAADFESRFKQFRPLPLTHPLLTGRPPSVRLWLWPQDFGGNGMFVAAWERMATG